jgi:hypothetical protein
VTQHLRSEPAPPPTIASRAVRHGVFRLTLTSEITIAAGPQRIWEVLTDFQAYGAWNQAMPVAQGEATAGTMLRVVIEWPGLRRSNYELEVLTAIPQQELRWLGHFGITGLMDGDHRFLIEAAGDGGARVTQTENFSGLLIPFFAPWLQDNVLRGFGQMNRALKARVEAAMLPNHLRSGGTWRPNPVSD